MSTSQHCTCPICLDVMDSDMNDVVALPCGHFLHARCGIEYFRRVADNRCLECRARPPDDADVDETKAWKYWSCVRNREARRDPRIRRLRQQFWDARTMYKRQKKKLQFESECVETAAQCLGMCEENFDLAVLDSLQRRESRILSSRAAAQPLPN